MLRESFEMKKILIFSSGSELYGSERGLLSLVDAIKDLYKITVVLPRRGPLQDCLERRGIPVLVFPLSILTLSLSPLYYLLTPFLFLLDVAFFGGYTVFKRVDLLYTNNLLLAFPSVIAMLLGRKHIWHMREFFPVQAVNQMLVGMARASRSAVICMSQNIKDVLFPGNDGKHAAVIYEGVTVPPPEGSSSLQEENCQRPADAVVLAVVSRIHPSKGQLELVKMMCEASKAFPRKPILLIVGDVSPHDLRGMNYKRKIEQYVRLRGMEKAILFCGFRKDIPAILSSVDVCVFPFQRNEPFGLALLEALVLSKRVLITMNPGSREILNYFDGKYKELSGPSLEGEIAAGKLPFAAPFIPEVFQFKSYKQSIRLFFERVGSKRSGGIPDLEL